PRVVRAERVAGAVRVPPSRPRVPARTHATRIRLAVILVVLLVLAQPVQRPPAGPHDAADGGPSAGPLPTAGDGSACCSKGGAGDRADGAVPDDLGGLVAMSDLRARVLIACINTGPRGDRGRRRD